MNTRIRLLALMLALIGALLSVPSAVAAGGHHADNAGRVHFIGLSNNPNSNSGDPVIALGVIHARGVDKVINNHTDRFVFPKGVVVVKHHRKGQGGHLPQEDVLRRVHRTRHVEGSPRHRSVRDRVGWRHVQGEWNRRRL